MKRHYLTPLLLLSVALAGCNQTGGAKEVDKPKNYKNIDETGEHFYNLVDSKDEWNKTHDFSVDTNGMAIKSKSYQFASNEFTARGVKGSFFAELSSYSNTRAMLKELRLDYEGGYTRDYAYNFDYDRVYSNIYNEARNLQTDIVEEAYSIKSIDKTAKEYYVTEAKSISEAQNMCDFFYYLYGYTSSFSITDTSLNEFVDGYDDIKYYFDTTERSALATLVVERSLDNKEIVNNETQEVEELATERYKATYQMEINLDTKSVNYYMLIDRDYSATIQKDYLMTVCALNEYFMPDESTIFAKGDSYHSFTRSFKSCSFIYDEELTIDVIDLANYKLVDKE